MGVSQVSLADDLDAICEQMQLETWGKDNEMTSYQPETLKTCLEAGGVLILAKEGETIVGAALCYVLTYPAGEDSVCA